MRLYGSFEKFGNYLLLDRMAAGGMAEVFIARPASSGANGRILIIKRILQSFTDDPESIEMFRTEVEICLGLNNPNIVQTYDFGYVARKPYIAMEFIDGKSLRQIITKYRTCGRRIHPGLVASIGAQAASGLHYAHGYRNRATGRDLKIVHRDISPQNMVLSYDGNLKIIDFGIAKALTEACHSSLTRAGTIKGKVSYLSPEQASLQPLDGRSDLFSLAVVLWELLTLEKLFQTSGKMDSEILHQIRSCSEWVRPPSAYNPEVPILLDEIILRALSSSPGERYQTGEELQGALRNFLLTHDPGYGYKNVAESMKSVFHEELTEEQKYLRELNRRAQETLTQMAEENTQSRSDTLVSHPPAPVQRPAMQMPSSFPIRPSSLTPSDLPRPPAPVPPEPLLTDSKISTLPGRLRSLGFPATLSVLAVIYIELDPIYLQVKETLQRLNPKQTRYAVSERPAPSQNPAEATPPEPAPPPRTLAAAPPLPTPESQTETRKTHRLLLRIRVQRQLRDTSRIFVNDRPLLGSTPEAWVNRDQEVKIRIHNRRTLPFERTLDLAGIRPTLTPEGEVYTYSVRLKPRQRAWRR